MNFLRILAGKISGPGARGFLASVLAVTALGLTADSASAAIIVVNTTTDQDLGTCSASCSLRDAVATASPGDIIQIPAGHYVLTLGDIIFNQSLTIVGASARSTILDGNSASRIFQFNPPNGFGTLDIADVALVNGLATTGIGIDNLAVGGAISAFGDLTLRRCLVANSHADVGGGISSTGSLTIDQCTIANNHATNPMSGFGGGGIFTLTSVVTITNSTLSGNTAPPGTTGGGAFLGFAKATLINDTIVANQAPVAGGLAYVLDRPGTLSNTIVAGNQGGDCLLAAGIDIFVPEHSLDSDNSCGMTAPGNLPGVASPLLGPLANNGGPTDTHALLAGSPAADAGNDSTCLATDQRGITRPQGSACDIGAYERIAAPDCSHATATPSSLWPPNHKFVPIHTSGVTNPGGGAVTISVTSIFQDEPVAGGPDATGVGTSTPSIRSERDGGGDGRVYHLSFTATNDTGGTCTGAVKVGVPHDQGHNSGPVDQGALYDSTLP